MKIAYSRSGKSFNWRDSSCSSLFGSAKRHTRRNNVRKPTSPAKPEPLIARRRRKPLNVNAKRKRRPLNANAKPLNAKKERKPLNANAKPLNAKPQQSKTRCDMRKRCNSSVLKPTEYSLLQKPLHLLS